MEGRGAGRASQSHQVRLWRSEDFLTRRRRRRAGAQVAKPDQDGRHPYILSLERFDITDGQLMIVMELADRSLWDRFRECQARGLVGIPREELLRYLTETA